MLLLADALVSTLEEMVHAPQRTQTVPSPRQGDEVRAIRRGQRADVGRVSGSFARRRMKSAPRVGHMWPREHPLPMSMQMT